MERVLGVVRPTVKDQRVVCGVGSQTGVVMPNSVDGSSNVVAPLSDERRSRVSCRRASC